MSVTEATMQGVTLFTKTRRRGNDAFELRLTYEGIEIRRPGEEPRQMSWDRVSEWEIEQRRGGVLLTLRGGGAVTPLIIPRWSVDELDVVLREVTSNAPPPSTTNGVEAKQVEAAPVEAAPVEAAPVAAEQVEVEQVEVEASETDETGEVDSSFEEVVSLHLAPPKAERPKPGTVTEEGGLVWPGADSLLEPLSEVPSLSWPGETSATDGAAADFFLPEAPPMAVSSFVASLPLVKEPDDEPVRAEVQSMAVTEHTEVELEPKPVLAPEVEPAPQLRLPTPPLVIAPREGSPDGDTAPVKRVERRRSPRTRPARAARRWPGNRSLLSVAITVTLLVALALAVSLVLAQSAGMISLPFLGSPG
jgi:hypothetical protein